MGADKFNKRLRKRQTTEEKVTVSLECVVGSVVKCAPGAYHTPADKLRTFRAIGYSDYSAPLTELQVSSGTVVNKLYLEGWPSIEEGDSIRAYIVKGAYERERAPLRHYGKKSFFVERNFCGEEVPVKVEKICDGRVIETYLFDGYLIKQRKQLTAFEEVDEMSRVDPKIFKRPIAEQISPQ